MISNTIIPLHPGSPERIDAANTIKYTLLLDYAAPEMEKVTDGLIPEIMTQCQKCCSSLFMNPSAPQYNFFGSPDPESQKPLAFLESSASASRQASRIYLHTMILQNCVMSSYHAVLSALLNGQSIAAYTLCNHIKNQGVQRLYQNNRLRMTDGGIDLHFRSVANSGPKQSSKASGFDQKIRTRNNAVPFLMGFMMPTDSPLRIQLQFSSLCQLFLETDELKSLYTIKNTKSLNLLKMLEKLESTIATIKDAAKTSLSVPAADSLYLQYLSERACSLNLFYSLIRNIKRIEESSIYRFTGENFLAVLSSCTVLPNPFTRTYFLRFAFDHIDSRTHSALDIWHYNDMERADTAVGYTRKVSSGFHFDRWFQQFDHFVRIMSQYIIPIYDWCFLIMLLECIEKIYPQKPPRFHLEQAMILLVQYMEANYGDILQPIKFPAGALSDGIDIVSSKNFDTLKNFCTDRKEDITSLFSLFFFKTDEDRTLRYKDISLSLKPLNPSIFKGKEGRCRSRILNNYFDLFLWPL